VWRGQSYAFSQWLGLQSVSPASLQDFTIGGSLSASSLYLPSWNPPDTLWKVTHLEVPGIGCGHLSWGRHDSMIPIHVYMEQWNIIEKS
jgi:hypothetical protein